MTRNDAKQQQDASPADDGRTHVVQILEATAGGTRRHLDLLLRHLPQDRFRLTAIVSDRGEPQFDAHVRGWRGVGVDVRRVAMGREIRPWCDWMSYRQLSNLLMELQPDVVHTHASKAGFLGRRAAQSLRRRGTRVYHTPHTFAFQWSGGLTRSFFVRLERFALPWCDAMICLSKAQYELAQLMLDATPAQLRLIPNGVDEARYTVPTAEEREAARNHYNLPADAPVVGMIGRLAPQKNAGQLVRAAADIHETMPDARFVLIGHGPLRGTIEQQIQERGLASVFQLIEYEPDTARFLQAVDVFMLLSLWEGLPYVVLEAMATGVPVVASDIPGTAQLVVPARTGYLVEPSDHRAAARHAVNLLRDAEKRHWLGDQARLVVADEYRLDAFLNAHGDLYESTGEKTP